MATKLNFDKLDLQIISEMMRNASVSYKDLGKKLYVSGGTDPRLKTEDLRL
jgi:Lrp/AsnC family transcriptional regulator for asnA, asnC and gidA